MKIGFSSSVFVKVDSSITADNKKFVEDPINSCLSTELRYSF